ncbi:hypothetical protein FQZ97_1096530 [compost metagenome]
MFAEQHGEAAEQTAQTIGADASGQAAVLAVAFLPATFGADQQANRQRAGEIQQGVESLGHVASLSGA